MTSKGTTRLIARSKGCCVHKASHCDRVRGKPSSNHGPRALFISFMMNLIIISSGTNFPVDVYLLTSLPIAIKQIKKHETITLDDAIYC